MEFYRRYWMRILVHWMSANVWPFASHLLYSHLQLLITAFISASFNCAHYCSALIWHDVPANRKAHMIDRSAQIGESIISFKYAPIKILKIWMLCVYCLKIKNMSAVCIYINILLLLFSCAGNKSTESCALRADQVVLLQNSYYSWIDILLLLKVS